MSKIEAYHVYIISMIAFLVIGIGSVLYIHEVVYSNQQAMNCSELYNIIVGESDELFVITDHAYQIYEVKCT